MGHRLSKIVTRTGDDGSTGLGDGSRTRKASPRIEAIGEVDELNSSIGLLFAEELPTDIHDCLLEIQNDLFDLGGELSVPGLESVTESHVARLERDIESINANLPPLKEFILPGGARAAAQCHVVRGVCRRAERRLVALGEIEAVSPFSRRYLNRLSDLLFVLAREINRRAQIADVLWRKERD